MRKIEIIVTGNQRPKRLDAYVADSIEHLSRSRAQQLVEQTLVMVNGKPVAKSYKIKPRDVIVVNLPKPEKIEAGPEEIPLHIIYEDDDVVIVNKAPGMVVHPAYSNYTGTMVNALLHHVKDLSGINGKIRPGIVHRIDKDTSGLLLVAKNDRSHRLLSAQFRKHSIDREYWALIWGKPKKSKDTVRTEIGRSTKDRKKFAVVKTGKPAVTHYEVLKQLGFLSLIKVKLETGRTHQIRVHMSHLGHPVFGDRTYGGDNVHLAGTERKKRQQAENLLEVMTRQALHARTLGFIHPATQKLVHFEAPLPDDFVVVMDRLK